MQIDNKYIYPPNFKLKQNGIRKKIENTTKNCLSSFHVTEKNIDPISTFFALKSQISGFKLILATIQPRAIQTIFLGVCSIIFT